MAAIYTRDVLWQVTTLTTVGYGDLVPTNDVERGYALGAMLCSALVFGYMISNIVACQCHSSHLDERNVVSPGA